MKIVRKIDSGCEWLIARVYRRMSKEINPSFRARCLIISQWDLSIGVFDIFSKRFFREVAQLGTNSRLRFIAWASLLTNQLCVADFLSPKSVHWCGGHCNWIQE